MFGVDMLQSKPILMNGYRFTGAIEAQDQVAAEGDNGNECDEIPGVWTQRGLRIVEILLIISGGVLLVNNAEIFKERCKGLL